MLNYMKRATWILLALFMLSACSSAQSQGKDPSAIRVDLVSEPATAVALQKMILKAKVTGLVKQDGATVQFDIRSPVTNVLPEYLEAKPIGEGGYTAEWTFDKPGTYTIYVHLYREDMHVTKKKQLIVT
ncbi:hypothetical protein BK127_38910 [Paenibacillus sp. FSL H7-0331]|nr:hypothetical protein BK127_38910 [Paenibacillus sp. FSL H7-0331]